MSDRVEGLPTRADGRSPDLVIGERTLADFRRVAAARPTQGDINEAYRGLQPTEVVGVRGAARTDYNDIPLKNRDGTLTKYARRMVDMHAPAARLERQIADRWNADVVKEALVSEDGGRLEVPARLAESVARARGLKAVRHYGRWSQKTYFRADGSVVRLVREGGQILEVTA